MGKNTNTTQIKGKPVASNKNAGAAVARMPDNMPHHSRKTAPHALKHPQQVSHTLMRRAVAKSRKTDARALKAQSGIGANGQHIAVSVTKKSSAQSLDRRRVNKAGMTAKNDHILKFAPVTPSNPALLEGERIPVRRVHFDSSAPNLRQTNSTADLVQRALDSATGHEQTYHSKVRFRNSKRFIVIVTSLVAVFAVVFIAGFHSINSVKLNVASSKAGFNVGMPAYKPAGFSLNKLSYGAGEAGLNFKSNSDDRAFSITEKTSNWDSNALRDIIVSPATKAFQTVEANGRTIYVDDQHTANWVDGGVWYHITNEGALSNHQLVQIANSL